MHAGVSTLGGGDGCGLGRRHGCTVGVTLGGAWYYVLLCSLGSCISARVRLVGGVVVGVGAPVAAKIPASFQMASMVWASKRLKGAAGADFERASARRLAASVTELAEGIAGIVPLWGETLHIL